MFRSVQFTSGGSLDYIPVTGVVADEVVRLQRNGMGVKYQDTFDSSPVDVDAYQFEWWGVDTSITLDSGAYILQVYNSVTTFRTVLYEIGPTVGVNYVYLFQNGTQQAIYAAGALDTDTDVRDGLEAAINAVTWTGFTVTCLALGTNQLKITFSDTSDFETYIGRITYKAGYYCTIDSEDYLLYYDEDPTALPTLPAIDAAYNFVDITLMPSGINAYLDDPNSTPSYSEAFEAVVSISEIPGSATVPDQIAVIDQSNQRIYFWEELNFGEVIKVFQK